MDVPVPVPGPVPGPVPRSGSPAEPKIGEALAARDALAAALTRAGIQLPAMDVRTPWRGDLHGDGSGRTARYALVQLGVCSAPVAHALAEVIGRGAER